MLNDVVEALDYIDPSTTGYKEWRSYGMALHNASQYDPTITYLDWDRWSSKDTRPNQYVPGLCEQKWRTFHFNGGITEGTIFHDAKLNGYKIRYKNTDPMGWNDYILFDGDSEEDIYINETIQFLKLLFEGEDIVNYVCSSQYNKEKDKYNPVGKGVNRKAGNIIKDLLKTYDITKAFGDYDENAGMWIRFNPMDGKGVKNENVSSFKYCLVESDEISIDEQLDKIMELKLPCAAITYSGSKSLHAIVHIDAENAEEYNKRVKWMYEVLNDHDFPIDQNNKNPSRMTRLPGIKRGKDRQTLIRCQTGLRNFTEWEDYIKNDLEDEVLPDIVSYADIIDNPPPLKPVLIFGVLRKGHKMIISGASKSGKSFALIDLATCVAEGMPWLGKECAQGKVLYLNFEIDDASFWERVRKVYEAKGWTPTAENIEVWNLRGYSMSAQDLMPKIIKRCYSKDIALIILDPIYKIQAGDENSAGDIAKFTNEVDKLTTQLGCSVAYCHHHSKGSQGFKRAMDRSSGSGVFSRDADAIIDVIELSNESYINKEGYSDLRAFRIEGTLREFESFEPINVFYDFPIYRLDEEGILKEAKTLDEFLLNAQNQRVKESKNRKSKKDQNIELMRAFDLLDMDSAQHVPSKDLCGLLEISNRTLSRWIESFNETQNEYKLKRSYGQIERIKEDNDNEDNVLMSSSDNEDTDTN